MEGTLSNEVYLSQTRVAEMFRHVQHQSLRVEVSVVEIEARTVG